MEISHFELIFKPQAPVAPSGTSGVETVLQGYFLDITNLEDVEYQYRIEFVIFPPPASVPDQAGRSLANNTVYILDVAGVNNAFGALNGTITDRVFTPSTGFITIPPLATAKVAVLPAVFDSCMGMAPPEIEVRGFVRLELPALLPPPPPFAFSPVPQSEEPVKVLVTAQNRAVFFDADMNISDQVQASVPISTGGSCVLIEPDEGGPEFIPVPSPISEAPALPDLVARAGMGPADMIASVLAGGQPGEKELATLNDAMEKAGIAYQVKARGKKS